MTINGFTVLKRAPRQSEFGGEVVLVDRGETEFPRYVTAIVSQDSLRVGEWFWGHYIHDLTAASADFDVRVRER